jgi:hypothetical protein
MDSADRDGDAHVPGRVVIAYEDAHRAVELDQSGVIGIVASLDGHVHHGPIVAAATTRDKPDPFAGCPRQGVAVMGITHIQSQPRSQVSVTLGCGSRGQPCEVGGGSPVDF